jgi:hypothetical protein
LNFAEVLIKKFDMQTPVYQTSPEQLKQQTG